MKTLKDVQIKIEGRSFPQISLSKLTGVKIKDVLGYISAEFGEPVFKITQIITETGHTMFTNGEHNIAYLEDSDGLIPHEQLVSLHNEETSD